MIAIDDAVDRCWNLPMVMYCSCSHSVSVEVAVVEKEDCHDDHVHRLTTYLCRQFDAMVIVVVVVAAAVYPVSWYSIP